jgi:hypothetical protein
VVEEGEWNYLNNDEDMPNSTSPFPSYIPNSLRMGFGLRYVAANDINSTSHH